MENFINLVEQFWQSRDKLDSDSKLFASAKNTANKVISALETGEIQVCLKQGNNWQVNEWVKKAILLHFMTTSKKIYDNGDIKCYDKIGLKFSGYSAKDFESAQHRVVPGAVVREGAYLGKDVVIMPSFINIGTHVGDGSLIDTWATIGSCAYIGKNCHISGGTGIGGVLEPLQARPVIIEDNCFIGARSEIAEGVLVEEGAVISMGVFISASTKIVNRVTGEISYGKIPAYSVVVSGMMPSDKPGLPGLYCAVIIKQVDQKTRSKTSINELLRQ